MDEIQRTQQPPKYWFASDFHFGHSNIVKFTARPFKSMEEQDTVLVESWNKYVKPGDLAFILGDFSFYQSARTSDILRSMNGQKTLVKGNHDHSRDVSLVQGWSRVLTYHEQKIGDDRVVMSHFPFMSWHQMHRGSYHLHGHSHGSMRYPGELGNTRIIDVGVDHLAKLTGEYRPMEWDEIKDLLSERKTRHSDDHHMPRL
jgi:calcineurin-like phosphoesterase family protein